MLLTFSKEETQAFLQQNNLKVEEVISTQDDGIEDVYDLSVDKGGALEHSFVANGIVTHNSSDPVYIANIMRGMGLSLTTEELFGQKDDESGEWIVKPKVRYYAPDLGDTFFDYMNKLKRSLPDKIKMGKNWYYVYDHDVKRKAKLKGLYDVKYLTKANRLRVPAEDGTMQAIACLDSYPAMLPAGMDKDDANGSMALQARMFSDGIKRVKGSMKRKRIAIFGVNQLRLRPATMFGNPEYEPGGEALKFFCFSADTFLHTTKGLIRASELIDQEINYDVASGSEAGFERPALFSAMNEGLPQEVLSTTLNDGTSIKTAATHRMYAVYWEDTVHGKMLRTDWITVDEISHAFDAGDTPVYLARPNQIDVFNTEIQYHNSALVDEHFAVEAAATALNTDTGIPDAILRSPENIQQVFLKEYLEGSPWTIGGGKSVAETPLGSTLSLMLQNFGYVCIHDHRTLTLNTYDLSEIDKEFGIFVPGSMIQKRIEMFKEKPVDPVLEVVRQIASTSKHISHSLTDEVLSTVYDLDKFNYHWLAKWLDEDGQDWLRDNTLAEGEMTPDEYDEAITFMTCLSEMVEFSDKFNVRWSEVLNVKPSEPEVLYDFNMPISKTVVTGGVISHNSDVRFRMSPRAIPDTFKDKTAKGMMFSEPSIEFDEGSDKYRFINALGIKNKLGGFQHMDTLLRLWVQDGDGQARGFDPVFDTWNFLKMLDLVSGQRNNMKFDERCPLHGAKDCTWLNFKVLILGTPKEIKEMCKHMGLSKPIKIREWCTKLIQSGKGHKRLSSVIGKKARAVSSKGKKEEE